MPIDLTKPPLGEFVPTHSFGVGLGSYWTFAEGAGTTLSDVYGGRHGTLTGSPLPSWIAGPQGAALRVSTASDNYVEVGDVYGFAGRTPFSVVIRCAYHTALPGPGEFGRLMAKGGFTSQGEGWDIVCVQNTGVIVFERYAAGVFLGDVSVTPSAVGTYMTLGFDYEPSGANDIYRVYRNGVLQATNTVSGGAMVTHAGLLRIGSQSFGTETPNIDYDWAAVWERVLVPEEHADLHTYNGIPVQVHAPGQASAAVGGQLTAPSVTVDRPVAGISVSVHRPTDGLSTRVG